MFGKMIHLKQSTRMPQENQTILTDCELLEAMKANSNSAFDSLYERYWLMVYQAAFKRLRDESAAEDITQDIFLQLWLRRSELQIEYLKAYLLTSVRNNVLKRLEKEQRIVAVDNLLEEISINKGAADAALIEKELKRLYETIISNLPKAQQQIFRMRFEEDLSTAEIADQLQLSRKTVQNQLGKSVQHLKESLLIWALLFLMK